MPNPRIPAFSVPGVDAPSPAIRFDLLGATKAAASRSGGDAFAIAGELGSGTSRPRPLSAPTPSTTPRDDTTEQS